MKMKVKSLLKGIVIFLVMLVLITVTLWIFAINILNTGM